MKAFEIFRTGSWTSDKGISKEYTEADLDRIIENYNSEDPAPIVIGHPETNAPAFGWIDKLMRVKDRLIAVPKQLNEQFVDLVKNGAFKKRSISITPDLKLVHVGFLGAAAPAVEGLKEIQFNSQDDLLSFSVAFNPALLVALSSVSSRAESRDEGRSVSDEGRLIMDEGLTVTEKKVNDETMQQLNNNGNKQAISLDTENILDSNTSLDYKEAIDSLNTIVSELKQNYTRLTDDEILSLNNRLSELQTKIQINEFESRLNEKILYGNLTPGMKTKVLELINFVQSQNFTNTEFAFNGFVNSLKEKLLSFIDAIPKFNLTDEFAKKPLSSAITSDEFDNVNVDEDSLELHKKALQFMKSNEGVSYVEAINLISKL